jgi:hypothetical protein
MLLTLVTPLLEGNQVIDASGQLVALWTYSNNQRRTWDVRQMALI